MVLVTHQMGLGADKGVHDWLEYGDTVAFHRNGSDRPAALNSDEHSLLFSTPAAFVRFAIMTARPAAQIFFVQFDDPAQLAAGGHHLTDRMAQFPGCWLGDTQPPAQDDRGDAFTGVGNVIHPLKPRPERQLGTVHRRFGRNPKLLFTARTFISA